MCHLFVDMEIVSVLVVGCMSGGEDRIIVAGSGKVNVGIVGFYSVKTGCLVI